MFKSYSLIVLNIDMVLLNDGIVYTMCKINGTSIVYSMMKKTFRGHLTPVVSKRIGVRKILVSASMDRVNCVITAAYYFVTMLG